MFFSIFVALHVLHFTLLRWILNACIGILRFAFVSIICYNLTLEHYFITQRITIDYTYRITFGAFLTLMHAIIRLRESCVNSFITRYSLCNASHVLCFVCKTRKGRRDALRSPVSFTTARRLRSPRSPNRTLSRCGTMRYLSRLLASARTRY